MPQPGLSSCLPCFTPPDTPSFQPRARSIAPLLPPPASYSGDSAPASCDPALLPPPPPREPGKLHSYYKMHPHFPPKFFWGVRLIVRKIWYVHAELPEAPVLGLCAVMTRMGSRCWLLVGVRIIRSSQD